MEYSRLVRTLIGLFRQNKIPYMIVGGLAVNYWGMPRATFDIDLVIALQPQDIPQLVQPMRALRYRAFLEAVSMNAAMAGEPAVVTPEDLAGAQAIERNTHHDGQVGCSITKPKDGHGILPSRTAWLPASISKITTWSPFSAFLFLSHASLSRMYGCW